jgi:penicillin-binding protein 2
MWQRPRRRLKNPAQEAALFRVRAVLGFVMVAFGVLLLAGWYFKLQVVDHATYALRSNENRLKTRPIVPGRGLILDRKGRVLAENVPAYRLDITPEQAGDLDRLLARLAQVVPLSDEELERFRRLRAATPEFRAVPIKLRLSDEEAARFASERWRFPGVELVPYLTRSYPYGDLFAHVIGYVGRVDEHDLARMGADKGVFDHIGKAGLERAYETELRGVPGREYVETDVQGRVVRVVRRVPATPGKDLRLGIDLDLQRAMVAAFGEYEGNAVAIDPDSGEILAMVSLPSYDPNLFINGISHADYAALLDNPSRPLFNRNVLGGGPPGSTVKPFIGLAGLDSGLRTPQDRVLSTGEFFIPGQKRGYRDAHAGGHGWTDLVKSISDSVNTYYYRLALDMGIDLFDQYMRRDGFGQPTGIDLVGETGGVVPSPAWKAKRSHEPWYPGETVISGIGQGYWVVTALQLARGTAALANGGRLLRPHLVSATRSAYNAPWRAVPQPAPVLITTHPEHLAVVQQGLRETVSTPHGTAYSIGIGAPYAIAGKTGTAQMIGRKGSVSLDPKSLPLNLRHKAVFIGYAPAEHPRIAVAVVVEHGGYGASTAAPIARKVMDAWLLHDAPGAPRVGVGAGPATATPSPTATTTARPARDAATPRARRPATTATPPASPPATTPATTPAQPRPVPRPTPAGAAATPPPADATARQPAREPRR